MNFIIQLLSFPFRLIGKVLDVIGRTVVLIVGSVLMVLGVALTLSDTLSHFTRPVGITLFIVGLLLMLRALA